ncbi:MAG: 16S rRNA (adenine(1518)-N(6)/adenine(1519)-N(6))-dimethyltransferase RsmA [Gammaproteobacteria bacterium]|nr:16S rRNA (adenine(1518)-N(6)/adenine(1519)-N(6))-dimethyltransferase RsmA [Gammaproteobacteria bacterium]
MDSAPHPPRKRFGQHFLHDRRVIERIVNAVDPHPGERLVEIGPGRGALTQALLERAGALDVVELDRDLARGLAQRFGSAGGLRVHTADALRFDFTALARAGERLRVVGNLPYNISTPLIFHLLAQRHALEDMHFMLQREIVDRLVAPPGGRDYGRLTVMVRYACDARRLFTVGAGAFTPAPRVASAFVRLSVRREPPVRVGDERVFERLVARCFSQRRKTLRNTLRGWLAEADIRSAGVDPGARPQTLDLEAFAALARVLPQRED